MSKVELMSKGNGRNFYGLLENGNIIEVVKEGGRFYTAKFIINQGLTAVGNPIKNFSFIS